MAFGATTLLAQAQNKTAGTSITTGVMAAAVATGTEFALAFIGKDNTSTTAGDNSEVTSVTDTQSNTWVKVKEMTNAGAAAAAITVSVWMCEPTTALTTSDTVTFNFASCTAKACFVTKHSKGSGTTLSVGASDTASADGATIGAALSLTPPDNREWLFVRAEAFESDAANWGGSPTTDWTVENATSTSGGGGASNAQIVAEYRIITTGAAQTSDPTGATSADNANVIFCLREVASGPATSLLVDRLTHLRPLLAR